MRKRIVALALALALCLCGFAHGEGIEDGLYTVGAESDASMFKIVKCVLRVEDGGMTAILTMSGQGYGYLYPGTAAEAEAAPQEDWIPFETDFEGRKTFAVPIPGLDMDVNVASWSIKYDKWYDRVLRFHSDSLSAYAQLAPDGSYDAVLFSDTALDGASVLLNSANGAMTVQVEAGDATALRLNGDAYAVEDGKITFPLPSLDQRFAVEVDGANGTAAGWLMLKSAGLTDHIAGAEDGVYSVQVKTDSGLLKVTACTLSVEDGRMSAVITAGNNNFDFVYAGSAADALADEAGWIPAVADAAGAYTYEIAVPGLDVEVPLATYSAGKKRWYDRKLVFDSASLEALAVKSTEDAGVEVNESAVGALTDGEYVPDAFTYTGGTGKVTLDCTAVRISGGEATAVIRFSSPNYTWVKVDGVEYDGIATEVCSQFEIPVKLNVDMNITAQTVAMSKPHEVEYVIRVELGAGDAHEGPGAIPGLIYESSMALRYATGFSVDYYRGGYALIDIVDGDRYLLVPEGGETPDGLDADIVVLRQPLEHIYLAATSAMALFDRLDALDRIRLSSVQASGWYVENAVAAMEAGEMLYGGKYSEPDYELMVKEDCDLAIESTMIYHSPKVKEMLELLGIPVFVERASYEPHPLGRSEWIRLYGLLCGRESEAEAFMEEQEAAMAELEGFENTEKTVAFFYISSDGSAVVRAASDYVPRMIEMAGGRYAFADLAGEAGSQSTQSISMEEFYATAVDADYLVYNATIDDPLKSIDALLAKNGLFGKFKAVREGNVYCTGKYLYQATDIVAETILDFHRMLTGRETEMSFLYKLS